MKDIPIQVKNVVNCTNCTAVYTNNTTDTFHVRIAVSGNPSSFTPQALAWCKAQGITEVHIVPYDLQPYPDVCKLIRSFGMWPVYSPEYALWYSPGFQNIDINQHRPEFQAIKNAGWVAFSSEGLFRSHVAILTEYLPFISFGGDTGVSLYTSSYYNHPLDSHTINCQEYYYTPYLGAYLSTLTYDAYVTPKHIGLTIGLWDTATLSKDPRALGLALERLYANKIDVDYITFNFWGGIYNPFLMLHKDQFGYGGQFETSFNFVKGLNGLSYTPP